MGDDDSENDFELFKKEMSEVEPLKPDNKVGFRPRRTVAKSIGGHTPVTAKDEISDIFPDSLIEDCPQHLNFSRNGIQHSTLKKLRSGKMVIENHLDLHGMTVSEAHQALLYFLSECEEAGYRHVLVVHGKGYSSPNNKPVIKAYVNRWLRDDESVLAFSSAQPSDGGTGAVYIRLKKTQNR